MPNRLAQAASPYLQQHADNPVDWWPWGPEAFVEAQRRGVPVLLSVGYSACHWCHVMAHESFEDPGIAELMNARYVSVKVDREERPDVDAVYMDAVTAMTGHGGWPMTVFLTPSGEPFYAGTYFPPRRRGELPGFGEVLTAVSEVWRERPDDVRAQASDVLGRIAGLREEARADDAGPPSPDDLAAAMPLLARQYDHARGGFGAAPKFPPSMVLEFLCRHHARTGSGDALLMAEGTLRAMASGGIYDQLSGGFARYSVDAGWVVPHFEKMLYDNALLARVALHIGQLSGRPLGERVAVETADFLVTELRTPEGGYASALDADTDGVEGKYYVWSPQTLVDALGREDGLWAASFLSVTEEGTFEDGWSTLQRRADPDDDSRWSRVRHRLREVREERTRPARDDKVVAGWNGLAIAALAEIGAVVGRGDLVDAATACAELLWDVHLVDGRLRRVSRDGVAGDAAGVLEDYAQTAEGWLTLSMVSGDPRWYDRAIDLLDVALDRFGDGRGGFFDTASDAEKLVRRPQEWTDNATPCGQASLAGALLTSAALGGEMRHRAAAEAVLAGATGLARKAPRFAGWWLAVAEAWHDGPREVAVVGEEGPERDALVHAAWSWPAPGRVVAVGEPGARGVPLLAGRSTVDGHAAAYVCREFRCERPTRDGGQVAQLLRGATE